MPTIPGFERRSVDLPDVTLSVQEAGAGAPLVLLHGFPQNGMCWEAVAPTLAQQFRVIVPDLRGYGQSEAPADDAGHTVYSKRRMAQDIVDLLDHLGIERANIFGHDRGARVSYRLALDHPGRVARLGIIEIVPTGDFWRSWSADLAMAAWHWTFLAQPAPLPERMIGGDPVTWLNDMLTSWTLGKSLSVFSAEALQSYRDQIADPAHLTAMCADYRAGATFDRQLDEADRAAGAQIRCPVSFLWAEKGFPARTGDPLGLWRGWAPDLQGASCAAGHFVQEENPQAVLAHFLPFFRA